MWTLRRLGLPAIIALAIAGLRTDATWAVCNPPSVADALVHAPVVFVGTVTDVSQVDGSATLHVEEIWKGPNLPDPVVVSPTPNEGRGFNDGMRYLVFPIVQSDGTLQDSCNTATSVYEPSFDALRPANAHPPQGPPRSGPAGATPIAAVFLLILVIGAIGGYLLYRTGRISSPSG